MGSYKIETNTTCSSEIKVRLKGEIIKEVVFNGGCQPIYQAISKLALERNVNEVIGLLNEVDTNCVNKETCISKLLVLLQRSKEEEIKKQKERDEYRISPEGFYKNLSILVAKPNIDFSRKYILVKAKPDIYDTLLTTLEDLPKYIEEAKVEKENLYKKQISTIKKNIEKADMGSKEDELKDLLQRRMTEKESTFLIFEKTLSLLPEVQMQSDDSFDGDYIFNTIWKEE